MANGFDRLERLFTSKRKASARPGGQSSPGAQPPEPKFPSPSFIRPSTTRMAARDEVRLRQASGRSPSVPDIGTSQRTAPAYAYIPSATGSPCRPTNKHALLSFNDDNRPAEHAFASLRDFHFPKPPSRNDQVFPVSLSFKTRTSHVPRLPSPRSCSPLRIVVPPTRLDTPPSSESEDNSGSIPSHKGVPGMPCRPPPTPGDSPELGPVLDLQLRRTTSVGNLSKMAPQSFHHGQVNSFDHLFLDRSYSHSSMVPSNQESFCSSTLREPDFNEFLNLSDDDIAESTPESLVLPQLRPSDPALPPMDLSISSTQPLTTSLLTLAPPRASRLAALAAFEAARIAGRYDFDLVYVVNLWPDTAKLSTAGPANTNAKPMMGRLLAAHGLHHVPSPLQISSFVHTTILRSDGWVEYRNEDALCHGLARGYACSFHTGQYPRAGSSTTNSPVSGVRLSERIDRGIVFAAYRKPRAGADTLGRTLGQKELGELHKEAEALVGMLIDIHVANRSRQPPTRRSGADETGPIPPQ